MGGRVAIGQSPVLRPFLVPWDVMDLELLKRRARAPRCNCLAYQVRNCPWLTTRFPPLYPVTFDTPLSSPWTRQVYDRCADCRLGPIISPSMYTVVTHQGCRSVSRTTTRAEHRPDLQILLAVHKILSVVPKYHQSMKRNIPPPSACTPQYHTPKRTPSAAV